jgi:membrane protein DedA with SNARE-associated domain
MLHWIAHLVMSAGYWGVGLLMAIENVVLPLPSELIMPLAGFAAARGKMSIGGVILAGTIGSVLGALPVYYLARIAGEEKVMRWIERHGRWLLLKHKDLERPKKWFDEHGAVAVGIGQLVPGVRGLISIPAGYADMNVLLFALVNFLGTILWCTVLAYAGKLLGTHYKEIHKFLGPAGWVALAALLGAGIWWVLKRRRHRGT